MAAPSEPVGEPNGSTEVSRDDDAEYRAARKAGFTHEAALEVVAATRPENQPRALKAIITEQQATIERLERENAELRAQVNPLTASVDEASCHLEDTDD